MAIDNRTTGRNYPLPHPSNLLAEDVQRLRDALNAIDADVLARYTKTEVDQLITDLIGGAPGALDTLNELAAALGDDANFAATVTNALSNRYTKTESDARYVQGVTQTENVFTGNGTQTAFTLSQTPPTRESLLVTVDGVVQPVSEYNLSGSVLILSEAPASGAKIRVLMLGVAGPVQSASTLSFAQAGTDAVTRTLESKLRDAVSVLDFIPQAEHAAIRSGVSTYDCTTAIQAALNAATAVGLTIYMPPGTYKTTSTLLWPIDWPVRLVGAGIEATHINYTGSSSAIGMSDPGASTKYVKSSIESLRLSGNGTSSANGINIRQAYSVALRNIRVIAFEVGVRIEQTWSVLLDFVHLDGNSQNGLELHNEANNITCSCCEFLNNGNGIYTAGSRAVLFSGCTLEANAQYGAYVTTNSSDGQSENTVFHGCYIEGNGTNDIRVIRDSGATNPQTTIIRDCYFVGMASKASIPIRIDQADHVIVEGCDFSVGTATYSFSLYISDGGTVSGLKFGVNRDTSTNGVYRGSGTAYRHEERQEARAWGRFSIAAGAISQINSFNVASITRLGVGSYEVTLRQPMASTDYGVLASAEDGSTVTALLCSPGVPISTTVFRIQTALDAITAREARTVSFAVFSQ